MQNQKAEDNVLYFNPQTAQKHYSTEMLMNTNKNIQPNSETDKKFDDLFNSKCSWTYKTIKKIKCQAEEENNEKGPTLKIRTVNIEETAYNRDFYEKSSNCLLNEYDAIETDGEEKPKKKRKLKTTFCSSKVFKFDSIKGNRNNSEPKVKPDKNIQMSSIRSKRNINSVSYVESDSGSTRSSSDDGLVFLTRGCDEIIANGNQHDSDDNNSDINKVNREHTSNIFDVKSNYTNNSQEMFLEYKKNNCKIDNCQNFKPQNCDAINEMETNFEQEGTCLQHQKAFLNKPINDDYPKGKFGLNSKLNQNLEKETNSPSSETLSSLCESDSNRFEEENNKPHEKGKIENINNKNDLKSEIIRQYRTISTEVQSVCDKLLTPHDESANDCFNGNFNLDNYKLKLNTDECFSLREERAKNRGKSKLLNEAKSNNLSKIHSHSLIPSNRNIKKTINRKSDNAKHTKSKHQKIENKTNSRNKDKSKIKSSKEVKGNYNSKFDHTPLVQDQNGAEDVEFEENEYPFINNFKGNYSFNSHERNCTFNKIKQKGNDSDDCQYDGKLENDKNTNKPHLLDKKDLRFWCPNQYHVTQESANSRMEIKENVSFGNTVDGSEKYVKKTPKTWEDLEADVFNREEQISFLQFNSELSPTRKLENDKNTSKPHLLDKKDLKFWCPDQYHVTQESANSRMEIKENVSFGNTANGSEKYVEKTPITWEDLEADIFNREEQISFLQFNSELSPTRKEILSLSSFNKPENSFETEYTKTQNKWGTAKSKKEYFNNLTSKKKVNDVTLYSPNASIIDRIIHRMQLCTSPVLTPRKVNSPMEEYQKSPILTEYSYSIQETKSIFLTGKSFNEKETKQLKNTWTNTKQKKYSLHKKNQFKRIIDSNEANITNLTLVNQNEIPKEQNIKLSKSSESDNESTSESSKISELGSLTPKSDKYLSFPQDLLNSSVDKPYNLRKRRCNNKAYSQNVTKKSIAGANNMNKSNTITNKNKRDKTYKQSNQNLSLIENFKREVVSIGNFNLHKRKKCKKSNKMDTSIDYIDESETETSSLGAISYQHDTDLEEKFYDNVNTLKMNHEESSFQTNTLLTSGKTKEPEQILQKKVCDTEKSMKRPKRKQLPKTDSKEEYKNYLQNIFSKDITEDSTAQWEFSKVTNETSENLLGKDKSNSRSIKLFLKNNDEELLSLSSDTDFEQPSPRRASGLLDDVFN